MCHGVGWAPAPPLLMEGPSKHTQRGAHLGTAWVGKDKDTSLLESLVQRVWQTPEGVQGGVQWT